MPRKVFHDSVTPLPSQEGLTPQGLLIQAKKPEHVDEKMTVLFSMAMPADAQAELERSVATGGVLTPEALQKFTVSEADVTQLVDWLKAQGFQDIQVSKDRSSVYATAAVPQIEQALQVDMVQVTKAGHTYTAARNAPSLPEAVSSNVHAIIGLQSFRQMNKHSRCRRPLRGNRATLRPNNNDGPTAVPNVQNAPPYFVSEILKAYGADGLAVTGKGQTIAILIDTFPDLDDVASFWTQNGLPSDTSRLELINVTGGLLPSREGEETLDAEWASGIARDAKIRVYASGSLSFIDLDRALDRILADLPTNPGMRQLSISLGLGETFMGGPQGEVTTQHLKLLKLAAAGVNVFVSSGDAGSNPDASGHNSTGPLQAEYESSDPAVIGVGGTTLRLSANGSVATETAWAASGGGKSVFFSRPSWQVGQGVPAGNQRLVPDVSLAADPETGAFIVFQGESTQIGGTSWSAPVWAGFCALINEARQGAQKPLLPFLNPLLYPLGGTTCFRDIDSGTNGGFEATPGYDLVTGLGVPNVRALIDALTN